MPTIDQILASPDCSLADPIQLFADGGWRWGNCQAILYDPRRTDIFSQPFLYNLYERTRLSGQRRPVPLDLVNRKGLGPLQTLFCGMQNLGCDSICKYLSERAVCVVGVWEQDAQTARVEPDLQGALQVVYDGPERFIPLGYAFPSTTVTTSALSLTGAPSNSLFAGYVLFNEVWSKPIQSVLTYLGLAWLFSTFNLIALHGSRYTDNFLTKRWMEKFGFVDVGTLPACMTKEPGGPLVAGTFSSLARETFKDNLRDVLKRAHNL